MGKQSYKQSFVLPNQLLSSRSNYICFGWVSHSYCYFSFRLEVVYFLLESVFDRNVAVH